MKNEINLTYPEMWNVGLEIISETTPWSGVAEMHSFDLGPLIKGKSKPSTLRKPPWHSKAPGKLASWPGSPLVRINVNGQITNYKLQIFIEQSCTH